MKKTLLIILGVLIVLIIAVLAVRFLSGEDNWICSNGQWVKHGNPSAAMPTTGCGTTNNNSQAPAINEGWKAFTDDAQKITFQYPETLSTKYVHTQEWPPKVTINSDAFSCNQTSPTSSLPNRVIQRTVDNNKIYCVKATSEGAAGSTYTTYDYSTELNGKLAMIHFVLRYPECGNYPDPQMTECQNERTAFDLDGLIDQIVQSIK